MKGQAKFLDAFSDRNTSTTTNNQQYADSFNSTRSDSNVVSDQGNTTVNLGGGADAMLDKVLPWLAIGFLVIAGLRAMKD